MMHDMNCIMLFLEVMDDAITKYYITLLNKLPYISSRNHTAGVQNPIPGGPEHAQWLENTQNAL